MREHLLNLATFVVLIKLAILPVDWPTAAAFFSACFALALAIYIDKIKVEPPKPVDLGPVWDRLESINSDLGKVELENKAVRHDVATLIIDHSEIKKLAEENKRFVTQASLSRGFTPPQRKREA